MSDSSSKNAKQTTSSILMIAPTNFGFNEEAFITNKFQNRPDSNEVESIQSKARAEFDQFAQQLTDLGVDVFIFEDVPNSKTPDSIFPNNWISTHYNGKLMLYPMAVSNRRQERRMEIVEKLQARFSYRLQDFSNSEAWNPPLYLEGTGSMIFDHQNKVVYAALSPRTDLQVLNDVAKSIGYSPVTFESYGKTGELIYHTNVMMCIGDKYVIIGDQTINENERKDVLAEIEKSGKEIILLDNDQVYNHFTGNMLQIENAEGETILVMSTTAYNSLNEDQINTLNRLNDHIVKASIETIERIGGGSARCMLAELFRPTREYF